MDPRLQTLIDKDAISDLVMAYCRAADRKDTALMRSLYHPDAVEDHGAFFRGPALAFIEKLPEIQAPIDILQHNITTHHIRLDGERAEGEVYVLAMHRVRRAADSFDVLVGGRYLDEYAKRGGAWKFARRAIVADWAHVWDPSIIAMDHGMVAGSLIGSPGPDDPSYGLLGLFGRGK
ncbi:MAG: nuclear transport factor 2 family protein [Sandarakinorhabdus sp.]|nr:nuclear transport factor 2 family protein [Sandarakinorhabdus sp.]